MNSAFINEVKDMLIAELAQYLPEAHSFEDTQIILNKIDEIAKGYESDEIGKDIPLSTVNKKYDTPKVKTITFGLDKKYIAISVLKSELKDKMLKYGFRAPDMTVTEFVEDFETL